MENASDHGREVRIVCGEYHLQHWEFSNLFVVGSSAFPPQGGDNPTPTILALAYGTADPIVSRYSKSPGIVN
jgi:gluconate 2-dehydrogenase alpha chain